MLFHQSVKTLSGIFGIAARLVVIIVIVSFESLEAQRIWLSPQRFLDSTLARRYDNYKNQIDDNYKLSVAPDDTDLVFEGDQLPVDFGRMTAGEPLDQISKINPSYSRRQQLRHSVKFTSSGEATRNSSEPTLAVVVDKRGKTYSPSIESATSLAYIILPFSERIIPINGEQIATFRDGQSFITLTNDASDYKMALERQLDSANSQNRLASSWAGDTMPPSINQCQTIQASIQLHKDDIDQASGRLLRTCKGWINLNRCEGFCSSGVQPSIKSRTGFKKICSCCNEGAYRRIQVRLNDCRPAGPSSSTLPIGGLLMSPSIDWRKLGQQKQQQQQPDQSMLASASSEEIQVKNQQLLSGYMDVEIEEPIECSCRRCDSVL